MSTLHHARTSFGVAFFLVLIFVFSSNSWAQDPPPAGGGDLELDANTTSEDLAEQFGERPLDGVIIEALEVYKNPLDSQLSFDLGYWPFNAYFTGFSINAGYTHFLSKTYAWEILQGSYVYTVDKNLTSQLADNYGVNPEKIERVNYAASSNFHYFHSYGKFIFSKEYIRYFRSGFSAGLGLVGTNKNSDFAATLGWRFEVYVNEAFSWKLELRDYMTVLRDFTNHVALSLGATYSY